MAVNCRNFSGVAGGEARAKCVSESDENFRRGLMCGEYNSEMFLSCDSLIRIKDHKAVGCEEDPQTIKIWARHHGNAFFSLFHESWRNKPTYPTLY